MPPGQLLEFNVKEGWEPLCLFLGKPAPSEDFPFVKESADHELASQVSGVKSHRRQMPACPCSWSYPCTQFTSVQVMVALSFAWLPVLAASAAVVSVVVARSRR